MTSLVRGLALDDDLEALDQAVREHAVGRLAADALGLGRVAHVELDVEQRARRARSSPDSRAS